MNHSGFTEKQPKLRVAQLFYTSEFYIFSVAKQVWEEEETKLAEQVNWYPKLLNFSPILLHTVSEKTYDNKKIKQFLLLHWNLFGLVALKILQDWTSVLFS